MTSLHAIGLSGLQASQHRMQHSAHNVANVNTEGFHRSQAVQQARVGGGVATESTRAAASGVALESEAVEQMSATYSFAANLQVIRTHDRMLGSLLDERA